jgi:hypothetical protein
MLATGKLFPRHLFRHHVGAMSQIRHPHPTCVERIAGGHPHFRLVKSRRGPPIDVIVTEIEALLAVDRGRVPPDTLAFFARDPDASERNTYAVLALSAAIAAATCAFGGTPRPLVAVILIVSTALIVLSIPTQHREEEDEPSHMRHVLVVTPLGIIVRDAWGLRSWHFDELIEALPWHFEHRPHLVLVGRDGVRHAVDYLGFKRGEYLRKVLCDRLKTRWGAPAQSTPPLD